MGPSSWGTGRARLAVALAVGVALVLLGFATFDTDLDDRDTKPSSGPTDAQSGSYTPARPPGALVRTTASSRVGVLLDEIPPGMRDRVAASVLAEGDEFWVERAERQLAMTTYRLVFRSAFYGPRRQSLPLPPREQWNLELKGEPRRYNAGGHDLVGVPYTFESVLLTGEDSPGQAEPSLSRVGGVRVERFVLPVDPELLLQRTGYACMDESQYPFNSVDSEEADYFYDDSAVVEDSLSQENYHHTTQPTQSCAAAARDHVGAVQVDLRFERLDWDSALAEDYRLGEVTGPEPDLQVYLPDFEPSRTTYRYINDSGGAGCELEEGSVGASGWRRLLQFATSDVNVGETALTIGDINYSLSKEVGALDSHGLFEFSPCHRHYHFRYYGLLGIEGAEGGINTKQAFCLQSTNRVANRETSPLHQPFGDCSYQGIAAGWIDQYQAGLPSQWLDTTDLEAGTIRRTFDSNPEGLLCEGTFLDAQREPLAAGEPVVWGRTDLRTENGRPVEAPLCALNAAWDGNNHASHEQVIEPHGLGLITTECDRGQLGPLRNCGFGDEPTSATCQPGETAQVTLSIPRDAAPQVVRLTEYSHALDSPVPARYEDSYVPLTPGVSDHPAMLANQVLMPGRTTTVTFACPPPRKGDAGEPGGRYALYSGPVFPSDELAAVTRG